MAIEGREKYYRIHTADIAYITQQPRGIFTAIGKLVDAGILSEEEKKNIGRTANTLREYCRFHHFTMRKIRISLLLQIAIKNQRTDINITTKKIEE